MAITAQASGTQTAVVGTEHTLLDVAIAGLFLLNVDTVNMVANDVLELRIYSITLTGGTRHLAYYMTYAGVQPLTTGDGPQKYSVSVANELNDAGSLRFTLKQVAGAAGRNFPWKVLKLG